MSCTKENNQIKKQASTTCDKWEENSKEGNGAEHKCLKTKALYIVQHSIVVSLNVTTHSQ